MSHMELVLSETITHVCMHSPKLTNQRHSDHILLKFGVHASEAVHALSKGRHLANFIDFDWIIWNCHFGCILKSWMRISCCYVIHLFFFFYSFCRIMLHACAILVNIFRESAFVHMAGRKVKTIYRRNELSASSCWHLVMAQEMAEFTCPRLYGAKWISVVGAFKSTPKSTTGCATRTVFDRNMRAESRK